MSTKHTATPWKWNDHHDIADYSFVRGANGQTVFDDGSSMGEWCRVLDPNGPDGRFIIRAVNSHDKLVEALENMVKCYVGEIDASLSNDAEKYPEVIAARAALALARQDMEEENSSLCRKEKR